MAIANIQYIVNIRSNVKDAQLFVNNENRGSAPTNITINTKELQESLDQAFDIRLVKENYISPITYRLFLTSNPNINSGTVGSASGFGNTDEFLADFNQDTDNNLIQYSNTPSLVIGVRKFENGNVVDYTQDYSQQYIELDFDLATNPVPPTGQSNESSSANIKLTINGNISGVNFIRNESQIGIVRPSDTYLFDIGDSINIASSNPERFRINRITVKDISIDTVDVTTTDLQSLSKSLVLVSDLSISVDVREIVARNILPAQISLVNPAEDRQYNINTKADYSIAIRKTGKVDSLRVVIGNEVRQYSDLGNENTTTIIVNARSFDRIGKYRITIIPRNENGDGQSIVVNVNVFDGIFVGVPDIQNIKYPSVIQGADYVGTDVDFKIEWNSVNTDFVRITRPESNAFILAPATGIVTLNVKNLLELGGLSIPQNDTEIDITLILTPYNESGRETIKGIGESLRIRFSKGLLTIPRNQAINRILDGFTSQLSSELLTTDASKYLTHTLHIGGGDNKVITTWTGSNGTLILKLYEPLPTAIQPNDQVWISKYQSSPIIETVTLSGEGVDTTDTQLKGPNFSLTPGNIDGNTGGTTGGTGGQGGDTGFTDYEELIASGSEASAELIERYLGTMGINTSILNIQYSNDTEYLFDNFVNFSSAEERVNNFYYKMKLIENYKIKLDNLTGGLSEGILLTEAFEILLSNGSELFEFEIEKFVFRNPTEGIEANKVFTLLNELLRNLDGFEKFLYTATTPVGLVYPKYETIKPIFGYPIYIPKRTFDADVIAWYDFAASRAREFDRNNPNYINSNIPEFINSDVTNNDFILFLDMIGHHFDNIWVYINALNKMRNVDEGGVKGVPSAFISEILKSLGWSPKRSFDSQFLWEYALGQNLDGSQKYSTSLEDANNQVWRRILNNLPYLLKHKGTARALKVVMATYGIPQSMLTIMEFGGPRDPTQGGVTEFTFDDRTASLRLQSGSSVLVPWKDVPATGVRPQSIEFMIKPQTVDTTQILKLENVTLSFIKESDRFASLDLNIGGNQITSSTFPLSFENYSNVVINKIDIDATNAEYVVYFKTSNGEKIIQNVSASIITSQSYWEDGNELILGNDYNGNLDEVRLWRVPLEVSKVDIHTLFPDSIAGNSFTASTADLMFRLDFERPKDRVLDPLIKNVAINQTYGEPFANASNFYVADSYPFQYVPYERTVTARVPSLGFNYSNKIRFENQYNKIGQSLFDEVSSERNPNVNLDLTYKARSTKKAFDTAPIDSNRLGLFFSPIKELNMDILKAFGDFNIDNYIGDPKDQYNGEYRKLAELREYYFQRLDLNPSEYIQLVRYINKSLFDVLADLTPARAKVSKGLLIEPHYLERSKVRWNRPSGSISNLKGLIGVADDEKIEATYNPLVGVINEDDDIAIVVDIPELDGFIDFEEVGAIYADKPAYDVTITYFTDELLEGTIPTFTASITYELRYSLLSELETFGKFEAVGLEKSSMANLGFGLYAEDTTTIWKRFDIHGNYTQSRENVYLVESEVYKYVQTQVSGYPRPEAQPGDLVEFDLIATPFKNYVVTLLPFPDTLTQSGNITNITPLKGYFPSHYKFVNNLFEGLQRTFFKGSTQTIGTTPDGLPPVETFTTNPNILRVANTGRSSGEPILIVD